MEATVYKCDVCRQEKGATNHWFIAVLDPRAPSACEFQGIGFDTFHSRVDDPLLKVEHICGQVCLHKRLAQWLETVKPALSDQQSAVSEQTERSSE